MKYVIQYECNAENEIFKAETYVECDMWPGTTDSFIIDVVLRDSIRFHRAGGGSIKIISISEYDK